MTFIASEIERMMSPAAAERRLPFRRPAFSFIKEADMRPFLLSLVAVLSLALVAPAPAVAQDTKTARGTVTAMTGDSLTVKVGMTDMKFMVDDKTTVEGTGAGTKSRAAAAAGKAGLKLSDAIKPGNAGEVSYHDMGGTLHAAMVRRVASAGSGGIPPKRAAGTVSAISATSITVNGTSGGATFTQTYVIDPNTRVVGKGAGTKAAAKGGKAMATDLIAVGDKVSVSFNDESGSLHATNINVTAKAAMKK